VSDAVNPGSQRTSFFVTLETSPQSEMDFLEQVEAFVRIGFVGAYQPVQCRAIRCHRFAVEVILAHMQGSPRTRKVVTKFLVSQVGQPSNDAIRPNGSQFGMA
jgi:hypothetical protein